MSKTKIINIRMINHKRPYYDIYIGRQLNYPKATFERSKWANPYSVKGFEVDESLELYEQYIYDSGLINDIEELRGKILGCWCKPERCHGDILIKLLDLSKTKDI